MIRVTVDVLPNGAEGNARTISQVFIANTLEQRSINGHNDFAYDYEGWLSDRERYAEFELYDRVFHDRNRHVWWLIRNIAINICDYEL